MKDYPASMTTLYILLYNNMGVYLWVDEQPITTAGIYHSPDLGLISISSDGSTWTTIADKNLGATTVWNNGDALSEDNCGKYYQRGNCYGFAFSGTVTTSTTKINPSSYGPGNYYSDSTFITDSSRDRSWMSTVNADLRGDTTNTKIARQGPCNTGFHVPTLTEMQDLNSVGINMGARTSSSGTNFSLYLKAPLSDCRRNDGQIYTQGNNGYMRTSNVTGNQAWSYLYHSNINSRDTYGQVMAMPIRPFKNEAVQPSISRIQLY